ncbi:protein artemis-like [Ylistrum balloti]|uniref:protein artemis-like n=1 Tax=Ylistrum balloti TaxID=509963 RepID=UPI002905D5E9|nr:protein artemis-like [Ylistrum balloti]
MSCFKGRMSEYRSISLDRFDGPNLNSTVYFLSHLHEDHTVGLSAPSFITRLKESSEIFLYCSEITKVLLAESPKYQHLERYIKTLPDSHPVTISIPPTHACKVDFVQVTLLPAAHCPGSVMFLFEGSEGTVLYTGDFRWEASHISNVAALHDGDSVKPIQSLYVDTTFCHPDCFHIPSRQDCVEAVSGLVKEWIAKGHGHVVHFTPRSNFGHEHLLKEISTRTSLKIHVSNAKVRLYEQICGLRGVFTSDPDETPIHACLREKFTKGDSNSLPCGYKAPKHSKINKMVILPSTMYFTKKMRLNLSNIVEKTGGIYRVCYSFHSSYSEVRNVVTYLKPCKVRPNVKPEPDPSLGEVQKRLNHFLKMQHVEQKYETVDKKFGTLKKRKKRKYAQYKDSCTSDSDELVFGSPDLKRMRSEEGNITPVKNQRGAGPVGDRERVAVPPMSPQEPVTPMKSDISDIQSSYAGSNHDDIEMSESGLLCDSGDDQEEIRGFQGDDLSTPPQSLLDAIDSECGSQEMKSCRVTFLEDEEQTVGQQAWDSPDVPDFGEEETNAKTEMGDELISGDESIQKNVVDADIVGNKSSQNKDISVKNGVKALNADSDDSVKCQGYQGDVDSSQEQTNTTQKCLENNICDLEKVKNVNHCKETGCTVAQDAKEKQEKEVGSERKSPDICHLDDELLEEESNNSISISKKDISLDSGGNFVSEVDHNQKEKSCSECNKNKILNMSQNSSETFETVCFVSKQQSKDTISSSSEEWKKNGSHDLFEDSNDGFIEGEMEGGDCQRLIITSSRSTSGKESNSDCESGNRENFDCNSSERKSLKDKQENKPGTEAQGCEDSEKQNLSREKSEAIEVTDLTQNCDEQPNVRHRDTHVCKIVKGQKHQSVNKKDLHRLSSCDTPGTSRSVCQCVLDASPQPDTILVEIQEDNQGEQNVKQSRLQIKRSPQKPLSKLLTNTQTNDLVIAILDSDSESDELESSVHKTSDVHCYESDSDMTLPPSQEVRNVTKVTEVCNSPDSKDEDVMIIDDDTEDDSDDSSSVSSTSSDDSVKNINPRSRLDKIQQALYIRNNETRTGDILGDNTADSDKLSNDSECAVIDLTLSDSEEDSQSDEMSRQVSHVLDES